MSNATIICFAYTCNKFRELLLTFISVIVDNSNMYHIATVQEKSEID